MHDQNHQLFNSCASWRLWFGMLRCTGCWRQSALWSAWSEPSWESRCRRL